MTVLLLAAGSAMAQEEPGFKFNVGVQLQRDSNLYRLPPGANAAAILGRSETGDTLLVKSAGMSFDQRYSLQKVHAEVQLVDYDYQRFNTNDQTAVSYDLRWDWAYTPQLQGRWLAERDESVNNFDGGTTALAAGNGRVQIRYGLEANYELDGRWSVRSAALYQQDRRDQVAFGADNFRQNSLEAGVRRSFGTGSHITARLGRSQGNNLNSPLVGGGSFRQNNAWLDLLWIASGLTKIDLGLTGVSRSHPSAASLDYSGLGARGRLSWQPTGKQLWTFGVSSALDSNQSNTSTHARTQNISISGRWSISARTSLLASVQQSRIRLLGHPTGGISNPRRDTGLETSLGLTWQPDDLLTLEARLQNRRRDSTLSAFDYSSTLFSVGLTARF